MDIDWEGIAQDLGMSEDDPEAIVHEMAHVYDCSREQAFNWVGRQTEVGNLLRATYQDFFTQNLSEIRTSVVTHLVLQQLGLLTENLKKDIQSNLLANLQNGPYGQGLGARELFEDWLEEPSKGLQEAAEDIAGWIEDFGVEVE
jgi:hypothetical protein